MGFVASTSQICAQYFVEFDCDCRHLECLTVLLIVTQHVQGYRDHSTSRSSHGTRALRAIKFNP